MSIKKQYEPGFKSKLAIELISDKKSVVEISSEYKVPQTNLHEWKAKLLDSAKDIFLPESERNKQLKILEQEINGLHRIIGEITVENNFLKKKLRL